METSGGEACYAELRRCPQSNYQGKVKNLCGLVLGLALLQLSGVWRMEYGEMAALYYKPFFIFGLLIMDVYYFNLKIT